MHTVTDEEIQDEYQRLIGDDDVSHHFFAVMPTILTEEEMVEELCFAS